MLEVHRVKKTVAWSTDSEIEYINHLVTFKADGDDKFNLADKPRDTLLKGYIASIKNRVRWGNVDRKVVSKHARAMLLEMGESNGN